MRTFATEAIRTVALIGHGGAGKTSLVEAMLGRSGAIGRMGRVEDASTTTDWEPESQKRTMSISLGIAPLEWRDTKLNLIDTPGYPDFVGEVHAALHVSDAAVVVLCAASGVEVGSEQAWRLATDLGLPRIVVINKVDRENADFRMTLEQARATFGKPCVPIHLPIGDGANVRGIIDLVHMTARIGAGSDDEAIPADLLEEAARLREAMVESIAEADDDLLARYLDGEELTADEIVRGLHDATREGRLYPVLAATATGNKGLGLLLDALLEMTPAPTEHRLMTSLDGQAIEADPAQPVLAQIFKSIADPYVGKLSYFRVLRGTLRADSHAINPGTNQDERLGQLYCVRGKTQEPVAAVTAGDIGAVAKLTNSHTGDVLADRDHQLIMPGLDFPAPSFSAAVNPRSKADLDKLGGALTRLGQEDPTIRVSRDPDTGETIMSGMGEAHLDIAAEKMHRKFGVDVLLAVPRIPYRETITASVRAEYKHKKQTGGHGQYGHVFLDVEPLPRGSGWEFAEKVVGGAVPRNFIPAVEKGVHEALEEGSLARFPVVDVRVTLVDGSYHPVDSSEMAFKLASSQAFRKATSEARPVILEPVWRLRVRVPDTYLGDVMGDLTTRRAHVSGTNPDGAWSEIEATAPLAEVQRYATELRSLTQGRGSYTMTFDHYAEVPSSVASALASAVRKAEAS